MTDSWVVTIYTEEQWKLYLKEQLGIYYIFAEVWYDLSLFNKLFSIAFHCLELLQTELRCCFTNVVCKNAGTEFSVVVLRSESPSGKCAKLHTVAASNNRDHTQRSLSAYASHYIQSFSCQHRQRASTTRPLYCCLFAQRIYGVVSSRAFLSWWIAHFSATPAEWLQQ